MYVNDDNYFVVTRVDVTTFRHTDATDRYQCAAQLI